MIVQERYIPVPIAANGTVTLKASSTGVFFCTATGEMSITNAKGVEILSDFAITAGETYKIPFYLGGPGGVVTLAEDGAGLLGVS